MSRTAGRSSRPHSRVEMMGQPKKGRSKQDQLIVRGPVEEFGKQREKKRLFFAVATNVTF